jgi:hypothetical protein
MIVIITRFYFIQAVGLVVIFIALDLDFVTFRKLPAYLILPATANRNGKIKTSSPQENLITKPNYVFVFSFPQV